MTSTSSLLVDETLYEKRRVRIERLLQIVSQDFDLRFEFGNRDLIGHSQIVMKAATAEVAIFSLLLLKARGLNLLGHYIFDSSSWYEAAVQEEARGSPGFARFWHALEDARIENRFIRRFPGSSKLFEANMLPNLGGKLLRRMHHSDQLEHGLYFEGRGYSSARYIYPVRKALDLVAIEIQRGAQGESARESFTAMLNLYPAFVNLLTSIGPHQSRLSSPQELGDNRSAEGEDGSNREPPPGSHPQVEFSDEMVSIGVKGFEREFPEWYHPGSAPWFERGLGKKEIHPSAMRISRQTIVAPLKGDLDAYHLTRNEIQGEVGYMAQRLTNLIREQVYLRFSGYYRTGRLNKAKLWKQRIGFYRLFQRPISGFSHGVAFSLLIDESASMKGQNKYRMAMKAALLLGETLDLVGVPLEIIGFTTEDFEARAAMKLGLTPAYEFRTMRCSALEHRMYKRFDEPYAFTRSRLTGIEPRHNNWDEEHLLFAFQRIQARPERRKVMIVISDGQPNGDATYLMDTVSRIESTGCKLIGVGIGADFVKQIYSDAVVVSDFRQMSEELLQILAREFRAYAI